MYGANVSPCEMPATMSKNSVSPSGEETIAYVFLSSIILALTVSSKRLNACNICSIFSVYEIECLKKSTNKNVTSLFFSRIS